MNGKTTSVKISTELYDQIRAICEAEGYVLSRFVDKLIRRGMGVAVPLPDHYQVNVPPPDLIEKATKPRLHPKYAGRKIQMKGKPNV